MRDREIGSLPESEIQFTNMDISFLITNPLVNNAILKSTRPDQGTLKIYI